MRWQRRFNRRVPTRRGELFEVLASAGEAPVEVVFEATFGSGWLADLLSDAGIPTHMAHPLATKAISSGRVKNDSVDAKTLAYLLRTNLLPEAWLAPPPAREARRLVRARAALVRIRARLKNQVHAVLAEHGVEVEMTDLFGSSGRRLLSELRLPAISQQRLEACLRLIDQVSEEVGLADQQVKTLFARDPRVERLKLWPNSPTRSSHRPRSRRPGQSEGCGPRHPCLVASEASPKVTAPVGFDAQVRRLASSSTCAAT